MPISILKLAREGEGASLTCQLEFDELEEVELTSPAKGQVTIYCSSDDGSSFYAQGRILATVMRQCDRCLKKFNTPVEVAIAADFSDHPDEEQWPIINNQLDFASVVREGILLQLPIKSLCAEDCYGIVNN